MPTLRQNVQTLIRLAVEALDSTASTAVCKARCKRIASNVRVLAIAGFGYDERVQKLLCDLAGLDEDNPESKIPSNASSIVLDRYYCNMWTYANRRERNELMMQELRANALDSCSSLHAALCEFIEETKNKTQTKSAPKPKKNLEPTAPRFESKSKRKKYIYPVYEGGKE